MARHRTTRRTLLPVAIAAATAAVTAGPSERAAATPEAVPRLVFPVVGPARYSDDFGDARGSGRHEGVDIVAPKRAIAVAAEAGTVRIHTTSRLAGCMLYLHGRSGTEYLYVHLNNDLTARNDNRGGCVPGVAYARGLTNGARVSAGQAIGYVGNSGDADATTPHLHFEVHPRGGRAVNPYGHLRRAQKLLFPLERGAFVSLSLRGRLVPAREGSLRVQVQSLRVLPSGARVSRPGRTLTLELPATAMVVDALRGVVDPIRLAGRTRNVLVLTAPARATLDAALGRPLALVAETVVLKS